MLITVVLLALAVMMVGGNAWAAPVPSQTTIPATDKPSVETAAAERALVQGKLVAYGLTQQEAKARVDLLTDTEVHAVAADLDSIQPGGTMTLTTTELLLALIVLILLVS